MPKNAKSKPKAAPPASASIPPEWNRNDKESWHIDFEKQLINDDKWTCVVTAAMQSEAENEICIQTYRDCVKMGLRKAVKIISMTDVVNLIKESAKKEEENVKNVKTDRFKNSVTSSISSHISRNFQIVELAAKYATLTETECILPPDLMAAVIKCIILKLKEENRFQKRVDAVRARKIRQQQIKAKFIREQKPFQESIEKSMSSINNSNTTHFRQPIDDEPLGGPDLYIMLVDFYNVFYFPEMLRIHIPFVALLKISRDRDADVDSSSSTLLPDITPRRGTQIAAFWKSLQDECTLLETTTAFKDIAMMQYIEPPRDSDPVQYRKTVFDELTWMQYASHCIYRQHQKFLQQLQVQRVVLSLEKLDLSKCKMYNKLCDALITGEPITPLMVLYAIVEQVVVGVPETKSINLDYHPKSTNFFSRTSKRSTRRRRVEKTSFQENKEKHESVSTQPTLDERKERSSELLTQCSSSETRRKPSSATSIQKLWDSSEINITESLIDQVLSERKSEKEIKSDKKWKTPALCSFGDYVFQQSFYCDPRLFDAETAVNRFLANSEFFHIWEKYPQLPPGERAYYNYHFFKLWKISQQRDDLLKLKIFFMLSTKLIGITKSYLYRGEEEEISEILSGRESEKVKKFSKVKFEPRLFTSLRGDVEGFSNYFFKTFIVEMYFGVPRRAVINIHNSERVMSSTVRTDSQVLMLTSHLNIFLVSHRSSRSYPYKPTDGGSLKSFVSFSKEEDIYSTLGSLLECFEISSLTDTQFLTNNEEYLNIIRSFKYYEKLEPNLMIQRLLEAAEDFNTIQCSPFQPTDTLIITMYNDFDHRGVFYSYNYGALPTPVALRDFYNYVYPEIGAWLVNENLEHLKFTADLAEKNKMHEEREDAEYLAQLNRIYWNMSPEKRAEFLDMSVDPNSEPEVTEKDLGPLPHKPKPLRSKKISFITTNLIDVRLEHTKKVEEFHSRDGTSVNVAINNWLYNSASLLKLEIKRSNFTLYYYQWLGQETNTSFTFKTHSNLIFSFYKSEEMEDNFKYNVTMSWPTGLLIRPRWIGSNLYVRQGYLKSCRSCSRVEDEVSRCYLKNGHIIVFKSNGDYDVLSSSGTKYSFYDSATMPRYEIISTTGEVWEIRTKGPCKNKRNIITRNKIFIGVDPKTQESYYKREDGMKCMLWQNGRLVTTYSDGTKITATPYFDEEEITVEWTEEEKLYFEQISCRYKSEGSVQEPRSRTILRNSSASKTPEAKPDEGFVSISCSYLMEHPKYSTIFVNPSNPYIKVTLPENLIILINPEGTYQIQHDKHILKVLEAGVEFQTICNTCDETSTVKLNLDSSDILCSFVDFFRKAFFVLRNGEITFQGSEKDSDEKLSEEKSHSGNTINSMLCTFGHTKSSSNNQRCFALERDLSGVEFLHEEAVALNAAKLPEDTHYEHSKSDTNDISHTFSSYYSTVGYEKWVMNYEDQLNSLPVDIKKKDLKELGTKQVTRNLFQYPFPKHHNCGNQQQKEKVKKKVNPPKLIVTWSFLCLSPKPDSVIKELHKYVTEYQRKAKELLKAYKSKKTHVDRMQDSRYVEMRLKKIALTLSQSLQMFPHLCTQLPSTEKEIHYFGHFIHSMQDLKSCIREPSTLLPNCKNIPPRLPRSSDFSPIVEEAGSP